MKVLLTTLNSKYVHSNLALKYLYITSADVCPDLHLKEYTINNDDSYVFNDIIQGGYDAVCFSCYIWNVEKLKELAENLREACPELTIIFGGPEVSYDSVAFLRENPAVDIIVRGEGEYTTRMLLERLEAGRRDFDGLKGLTFRRLDSIGQTEDADMLVFESIPFPYSHFPCERDKVIYYESSRGCPFRCSYCLSSLEKKMRALPAERVKEDLKTFLYAGVPQVKFLDRTFNWDAERAYEIIKFIILHDLGRTNFHMELCAELLRPEMFSLLERARDGLFQFEVGIQSVNPETLLAVDRSDEVENLLEKTRKLIGLGNCRVHVDLIAGLPFEDYECFQKSFNAVYDLGADAFQLGFLKLLHGTKIRKEAAKYGYKFKRRAPYELISNRFISAKDVARLRQIAELLELYGNRGGFENTIEYAVRILSDSAFGFFEEFAVYYTLRGYHDRPHRKEDLYRILREYVFWKARGNAALERELEFLTEKDLRDNMNAEAVKRFMRKGWVLSAV